MTMELEDGPVKAWYVKTSKLDSLYSLARKMLPSGYVLDKKSGLLVKELFCEPTTVNLGHTTVAIIFPRPTDLHYHPDVDEAISVVGGSGMVYTRDDRGVEKRQRYYPVSDGFIPRNVPHSIRPYNSDFVEIIVSCSGILDMSKEVCVERFDELTIF